MAGYTEDEINSSVDQFLSTAVQVRLLPGGVRDVNAARDAVYDLLTTALVLRPESYFYLVWLARNALLSEVREQLQDLDTIIEAAAGSSRTSKLVTSTTELVNARAALLDLNAGLNERSIGVRGSLGPGVERFRRSVGQFVSTQLTKNVLVDGTVTETPEELRAKISSTWQRGRSRHAQLLERIERITTALATLADVALPETTISSMVTKMRVRLEELEELMKSPRAVRDSRTAMLELLTMRTLMARASSFRSPSLVLFPVGTDDDAVSPVDSAGLEASTVIPVSGPFNYRLGSELRLLVNGVATNIPLPGTSSARIRSKTLSFPGGPASVGGFSVAVGIDGAAPVLYGFPDTVWASGPAAAAALDAITADFAVEWDAATSQLVFTRATADDANALAFYDNFTNWKYFTDWAFGIPVSAGCTPIDGDVLVQAITQPTVRAQLENEKVFRGKGARGATSTELSMIYALGSDGVVSGTSFTSASTNFQNAGVRPGFALSIASPPAVAGIHVITDVGPNSLTLASTLPNASGCSFGIGPDLRGAAVGSRVFLDHSDASVRGWYRLAAAGAISVALSRPIGAVVTGIDVSIFYSRLTLSAVGTTTSSSMQVLMTGGGAPDLGYTGTPPLVVAALSAFSTNEDLLARGVRVGDLVTLVSPTATYERIVATAGLYEFEVSQPVPYEAGAWSAQIRSAPAQAFHTLAEALDASTLTSASALDFEIGRLVAGGRYTGDVQLTLSTYYAQLEGLAAALEAYVTRREPLIDAVVRMMEEQGFDRALDLLLRLDIALVFSMSRDGVSYASRLIRASATAARELVPVSRHGRSPLGVQELRPTSFQLESWHTQDGEEDR